MSLSSFRINQPAGTPYAYYDRARRDIDLYSVASENVECEAQNKAEISYLWEMESAPEGVSVVINNAATHTCNFRITTTGGYLVKLTVNAGLPAESMKTLYFGVPLANTAWSLPALGETNQDNSQSPYSGERGAESKISSIFRDIRSKLFDRQIAAEKGAANGYAGLDASAHVVSGQLDFGTASGTVCEGDDERVDNWRHFDGITWTSRTSAADNTWRSISYGNGIFVAVGSTGTGNRVMTSYDGITWTSRTSAADNEWYSVSYGNGIFVAVGSSGSSNRVMTSYDGIAWTSRSSAADNVWLAVSYGNGMFVAVSASGTGNRVMTSGKQGSCITDNSINIYGELGHNNTTLTLTIDEANKYHAARESKQMIRGFDFIDQRGGSVTAVSQNGSNIVMTSTAHGLSVGDVITTHGFSNGAYSDIFEVKAITTDTFEVTATYTATDTGNWARGGTLVCVVSGVYKLSWAGTFSHSSSADSAMMGIVINTTPLNKSQDYPSVATSKMSTGLSCFIDLEAGDKVFFAAKNNTTTNNISIYMLNVNLHLIDRK